VVSSGRRRTVAPSASFPDHAVPVTTVPNPGFTNVRSIGSRNGPSIERARLENALSAATSWSRPRPVTDE
jgi:hypothetical protein